MRVFNFFIFFILLISCNNISKKESVFDSEKLIGKYKLDITPLVNEVSKSIDEKEEIDNLAKGFATLMFSSIEVELNFYKENNGVMTIDGAMIDFASAFTDEKFDKVQKFQYKVENDSVLLVKMDKMSDYKRCAILRKYSMNYDFLQFITLDNDEHKLSFNLTKIGE
jgi:hypothetical protein